MKLTFEGSPSRDHGSDAGRIINEVRPNQSLRVYLTQRERVTLANFFVRLERKICSFEYK